jgi:predicted ATPase
MRIADFSGIKESAQEAIALYDRERHRDHAYYFGGHDARVCSLSFYALSLWGLGFPEQARQMAWRSIEDGRDLGHTFSIAHGLNMGGLTLLLLGDIDACRTVTEELYPIAERNKFPWPLSFAKFQRGWLASQAGERDGGIELMLKAADEAPAAVLQPIVLTLIAEQQMLAGRFEAAIGSLDRAMDELNEQRNLFYEAETCRIRGEVLLAQSRDNAAEVETIFRRALAVAARQANRPLELRGALSVARLLCAAARETEARALLQPIYAAFTEGFDEPDMRAAKALLAQLH